MKKIEAYIRPEKLEIIRDMLERLHLNGLSFSQVMGCGNQKGWKEVVRGSQVDYNFLPKIKLELVVLDNQVDEVIEQLIVNAHTGDYGDGKIFVSEVADAVRIRTRERGEAAIR